MGNGKFKGQVTRFASRAVCAFQAFALSLPVAPIAAYAGGLDGVSAQGISKGDTAPAMPDIDTICKSIDLAMNGDFAKNGAFTTLKEECANLPRRRQNDDNCRLDRGPEIMALTGDARQTKIDQLCAQGGTTLIGDGAKFCAIRAATQGGQAKQYCEAYNNADKAQKGVIVTTSLDVAAAGICWAEALSMQTATRALEEAKLRQEQESIQCKCKAPFKFDQAKFMGPGSIFNKGICGGAAMAAGVGELVQTSRILIGGKHSAGDYRIDADNNVQERKGLAKTFEVVASAGLSLAAIKLGVCYYASQDAFKDMSDSGGKKGLCSGVNNAERLAESRANTSDFSKAKSKLRASKSEYEGELTHQESAQNALDEDIKGLKPTGGGFAGFVKGNRKQFEKIAQSSAELETANTHVKNSKEALDRDLKNVQAIYAAFAARANLAKQAAILFTGLTAMRAVALNSAATTKKKSKEILQSMFVPAGGGTTFGSVAVNPNALNVFSTSASSFSSGASGNQPVRSSAVAAGSPEGFLLPPGSPQAALAENVANQIPQSKIEQAAATGGGAMGDLIAATAAPLGGAGAANEIKSAMASAFANLPKEEGGYGGGGGGSLAKKGDSGGGDLNLKSLFGGENKEEGGGAGGGQELAYRTLASEEDIWHSQNPKGNNLFQIVSDRYDTAQRKLGVAR